MYQRSREPLPQPVSTYGNTPTRGVHKQFVMGIEHTSTIIDQPSLTSLWKLTKCVPFLLSKDGA